MTTAQIHIKKGALLLALIVCLFAGAISGFALTDASNIEFTLALEPNEMSAPGSAQATITVTNKGTEDITVPMTVYDPSGNILTAAFDGGVISLLPAGESQTWTGAWNVTQEQLDAGKVTFTLRLNTTDAAGAIAQVSLTATGNISFQGDRVSLDVQRVISPEVVRRNSVVTVTYTLTNTGNVRLTNIRLRENGLISNTQQNADPLDPGQSTTVRFTKTAGSTALESSAVVFYQKAGSTAQLRETVDTVAIPVARPGFSSELTADKTSVEIGEKVVLTLTLSNQGNIDYTNINVTDAINGSMFTGLKLPAGETLTQTKEVTLMTPTNFKFNLELEDNTGTKQTETTNEVRVSAYAEGQQMQLNVQATADRESVDALPGLVRFSILITNDSNSVAKPVNVYHGEMRIASIPELAPGASTTVTREFSLSQAGRYRFSVRTVDALENTVSFDSQDINIAYAPPTVAPTAVVVPTIAPVVTLSPLPETADGALGTGRNALFILMIGLGVLFAGSLLLFLTSSIMRARTRAQSDAAYDHLQTAPKRDFADASTYGDDEVVVETVRDADGDIVEQTVVETEALPHEKYLKEETPLMETDPELDAETPPLQDEGYRLTREEGDTAEPVERRTRRAAKRHKLPEDE